LSQSFNPEPAATAFESPTTESEHGQADRRGADFFRAAAESRRQSLIAEQLALTEIGRWRSYASGAGGVVFYRAPLSLEAAYGIAPRYPAGGVFEPWPYVPGDIWGYPYVSRVRQPIGQRQMQTGPNRWESFPIYEEDLAVEPPPAIAPPVAAPPIVIPHDEPPPPLPPGPRAF
jgi:hypothetical protein